MEYSVIDSEAIIIYTRKCILPHRQNTFAKQITNILSNSLDCVELRETTRESPTSLQVAVMSNSYIPLDNASIVHELDEYAICPVKVLSGGVYI